MNHDDFYDRIQNQTNVDPNDLQNLANAAEGVDFQDEATVRQLINEVARMAGTRVTKEKEDYLVHAITSNQVPLDFATLNQLFRD